MASMLPSDPSLSQIPPAPQDLAWKVLGPRFAGWGASMILYGISLATFIHYVQANFARETRGIKVLMWTIMILETTETGLLFTSFMRTGTSQRRDFLWLVQFEFIDSFVYPGALCALLVQTYLARRVILFAPTRRLSWLLAFIFGLGILTAFAGHIALAARYIVYSSASTPPALDPPSGLVPADAMFMALVASAFTDTLISASLTFLLLRNVKGFNKRNDSMLKKIVSMTLFTASYTAIVAICGAVLTISLKNTIYASVCAPFFQILSKLYTLSLFTTSIFRRHLQSQAQGSLAPPTLPTIRLTDPKVAPMEGVPTLGVQTERLQAGTFGVGSHQERREEERKTSSYSGKEEEEGISEGTGWSTTST